MSQYFPKSYKSFEGNIDKLVTVPVDLSKLSEVVKSDVVKKAVHD